MHDALLDSWTKFAIRSAVINGTCVRGARCTTALDGGVSSTPTGWLFSVVRDYDTGLPTQGVKVEEKNRSSDALLLFLA